MILQIEPLIYSFCMIFGTFGLSSITAYSICSLFNQPFIHPKFTNEKIRERTTEMVLQLPILLLESVGFVYISYPTILSYSQHTWVQTVSALVIQILLIEANYYVYHRGIHSIFYKEVHKKHHENVVVYPFDTFYLTQLDDLALIISLGTPVFIYPITSLEQFMVLYLYITTSYLSHSELFWKHHSIHHKYIFCNYCILFPIFDILFGTYKIDSSSSNNIKKI